MSLWLFLLALHVALLALMVFNMWGWPRIASAASANPQTVSVLIPARNEEQNIATAINQSLTQTKGVQEVLVYDDHSTDGTADAIQNLAAKDQRVRLIPAKPLPDGWCGKPFACAQLAAEACGDWLLFMDADTRLEPDAVSRIVNEANQRHVSFLSCWPKLDIHGFWESVFMPMLNFVVFTLFPAPLSLTQSRPSLGLAHGACILAHRLEYEKMGGHAVVKSELFEDTALARAWRAHGLRGICLDGQDVVRVRMYDSLSTIWHGFQKILYPAFRHEISFWLFLLFHSLFIIPFAAAPFLIGVGMASFAVWCAAGAVLISRLVQARRFRYPYSSALLHPLVECALVVAALVSWYRYRFGKGVQWKGRAYRSTTS